MLVSQASPFLFFNAASPITAAFRGFRKVSCVFRVFSLSVSFKTVHLQRVEQFFPNIICL